MPFDVHTDTANQILHVTLTGDVDYNTLQALNDDLTARLEAVYPTAYHILLDLTQVGRYPNDVNRVAAVMRCLERPNLGRLADFGSTQPHVLFVHRVIAQVVQLEHSSVATRKEALAFIHARSISGDNQAARLRGMSHRWL